MSGGSMFELRDEKFFIVDVDKVYVSEPVRIRQPANFGSIRLYLDGKIENRGGMSFEFGDPQSTLGFDRVTYKGADDPQTESGFSVIEGVMEINGSDSNLEVQYYRDGILKYRGAIIPSSLNESFKEKSFRVKKLNYGDKFNNRADFEIDIESDEDLDGNKIAPAETISLPMHSKKVFAEGIHNVFEPELFDGGPSVGTGITYNAGLLWGIVAFNDVEKNYENMVNLPDLAVFSDEGISNDTERYATKNPLVAQSLYAYKANGNNDVIQLSMRHVYDIVLDTTGVTGGGSTGDGDEIRSYRVVIWIINRVGDTVTFKEEVEQVVPLDILNISSHTPTVDFTFSQEITLDAGDEIYYAYSYALGGSISWPNFQFDVLTTEATEGYFIIESVSSELPTNCRAMNIFDTLNTLIQKAVGTSGVSEMKQWVSEDTGTLTVGEYIDGQNSNASGKIFAKSGLNLVIIEAQGTFEYNEQIIGRSSGATATILHFSVGQFQSAYGETRRHVILESSILQNKDSALNGAIDGCGGMNYVSNVFAVRDFIEPEYNALKYYKEGDKVRYEGNVYRYINGTIDNGNLPTNATYWELTTGRAIKTSLKKILDFVRFRYGLGVQVINKKGSGFGTDTTQRITKVKVEKMSEFFQDKQIMQLDPVLSVVREINPDIIYNKIKSGYKLYSKPNESESINAYLTEREDLTPIEKDENTLDIRADVLTDSNEIERFRRLKFSNASTVADSKDDETVIIKCVRINSSNPISYLNENNEGLLPEKHLLIGNTQSGTTEIRFYGFYFGDQIQAGEDVIISGDKLDLSLSFVETWTNETVTITDIIYNEEDGYTSIFTTDLTEPAINFITEYSFYFSVDFIAPQRSEGFSNIKETVDQYTEYNIDHVISNFLINNFPWYGSGLEKKANAKRLKFTSGKSNVFFQKEYDSATCEPADEIVIENQDFTMEKLRTWNDEIFGIWQYTIVCKMDFDDFSRFVEAVTSESDEDINDGYVLFPYGAQQVLTKAFPMRVGYSPRNKEVEIIAWHKKDQN